jgi:hypothetical protein
MREPSRTPCPELLGCSASPAIFFVSGDQRGGGASFLVAPIPDVGAGCRNGCTDGDRRLPANSLSLSLLGYANTEKAESAGNRELKQRAVLCRAKVTAFSGFSLLFINWCLHDLAIRFPRHAVHAATRPPKAQDRFPSSGHGGGPSHHLVNAAQVMAHAPFITSCNSYLIIEINMLMQLKMHGIKFNISPPNPAAPRQRPAADEAPEI